MRLPARAKLPSYFGTEASCLCARLHSVTNDVCMSAPCWSQADSKSWNCQDLRCVPSIASAAFFGQIEFLPRTCSTQFCRFRRKAEIKYFKHRSEGHKSDHGNCPNFEVVDLSLWKNHDHRSSTSKKLVVRAKVPSRFQALVS